VITLSHFAEQIPPFHVMALLERAQQLAAQGHDVIHLEVGEPDFETPAPVLEAIAAATRDRGPATRQRQGCLLCARRLPMIIGSGLPLTCHRRRSW